MTSFFKNWQQRLNTPYDAISFNFFRSMFGFLMVIVTVVWFSPEFISQNLIGRSFYFPFTLFEILRLIVWPEPIMYVHFIIMGLSAICIMAGVKTRIASFISFLFFGYIFLIDKALYLDGAYLILLISFLFCLFNGYGSNLKKIPFWQIYILRFQFLIIWFFQIGHKSNKDWILFLGSAESLSFETSLMVKVFILLLEVAIFFFLLRGKKVLIAFACFLVRTVLLYFLFMQPISIMTLFLMAGFIPFVDTRQFKEKLKAEENDGDGLREQSFLKGRGVVIFVVCYVLVQIAVPLRSLAFPGKVSWTGEGQRFSWRGGSDQKNVNMAFSLTDMDTGQCYAPTPEKYLTKKQLDAVETMPDVTFQYVQELKEILINQGIGLPEVVVNAYASLNGRPYQPYIYSDVNLANSTYPPFSHAAWIVSFKENRGKEEFTDFKKPISLEQF